jgi:hypothetical protein
MWAVVWCGRFWSGLDGDLCASERLSDDREKSRRPRRGSRPAASRQATRSQSLNRNFAGSNRPSAAVQIRADERQECANTGHFRRGSGERVKSIKGRGRYSVREPGPIWATPRRFLRAGYQRASFRPRLMNEVGGGVIADEREAEGAEPLANPGVSLSAPGVLGEGSKDPRYGAASDARRQSETSRVGDDRGRSRGDFEIAFRVVADEVEGVLGRAAHERQRRQRAGGILGEA